jgi:hypothetical protein
MMNDEGLLENSVSATEEVKQLLDGIVSSMMEGEKDDGKEMKNAEQWCFSIGKTDERLLTIGVSATEGKVAANGVAAEEGGKAKQVLDGVVSGVRMMGEWWLGCFYEWEEMESAEQRCFSVGETVTSVLQRCFSIGEMNSAAQRCFSIMKKH